MVKIYGRNTRGNGLKFSLSTYNQVRNFTPLTPIKYGPNPKRPGSKSYFRYDGYKKATTVGEALKLGSKVADLSWELQRGDYKVLPKSKTPKKTILSEKEIKKWTLKLASINGPRGLALDLSDKSASTELEKEERWQEERIKLCAQWAKKLGVKLESETRQELTEDGVYETADTRNGRLVADAIALSKLQGGGRITEQDVTDCLRVWGFVQNYGRLNVLPGERKWVYSDTLGAIKRRTGGFGLTPPTKRYPNVMKLLNQWLLDNRPEGLSCDFAWTSININANYGAKTHRDGNNVGPSAIRAFGDFMGGELRYWSKDDKKTRAQNLRTKDAVKLNIKKKTAIFDGNLAHAVESFSGERISVVWFSCRNHNKVGQKNISWLKSKCNASWPTEKTMGVLKKFVARK
jgi:hypothetical protein